jgi:L-ascorbate metabolism protein UlaG (beta-lactamase superfamily)
VTDLRVDFLGHAMVLIETDGVRVLTDPAFRGRIGPLRRVAPVPDVDDLGRIDVVLISHLHWDHLDLPSLARLGRDVRIVVPAPAGAWLRAAGFPNAEEIGVGGSVAVGSVVMEAVPARHGGFRPPRGPRADPLGFVIRGSRTVYFAGDTDLFDEMSSLGRLDVALIPVWGWGPTLGRGLHLDPQRAAEALLRLRPRVAVPIHWGTYWPHAMGRLRRSLLIDPPRQFAAIAAELAPEVRVLTTEVGARVDLPDWAS